MISVNYLRDDLDDLLQLLEVLAPIQGLAIALVVLGDLEIVGTLIPHLLVCVKGAQLTVRLLQDVVVTCPLLYGLGDGHPVPKSDPQLQLQVLPLDFLQHPVRLLQFPEIGQYLCLLDVRVVNNLHPLDHLQSRVVLLLYKGLFSRLEIQLLQCVFRQYLPDLGLTRILDLLEGLINITYILRGHLGQVLLQVLQLLLVVHRYVVLCLHVRIYVILNKPKDFINSSIFAQVTCISWKSQM